MRTEQEIIRRIKELEEENNPAAKELKWVLQGTISETRERELFDIYHCRLKGKEKTAFNALRRFEAQLDRVVTLDEVKAESFIFNSNLVGFGKNCREMVLKNPENYLF